MCDPKKEDSQVCHLSNDLDRLVDRYREEYDISYAAVIGVLFTKAHFLCDEAARVAEEEDED